MSTTIPVRSRERLLPAVPAVVFTTVVTGWFGLAEALPISLAVLTGAGWGLILWLGVSWINRRPRSAAWTEEILLYLSISGFAFAGCGGLMALLLLNGAITSDSLTGDALAETFLPSIPYYIAVNMTLETLVVPALLLIAWRPGHRRTLVVSAAVLYFAMRVWTYLTFVPARLGWAESDHSDSPLTAAERQQAAKDLMLDDPRWIMLLVMYALLLFATRYPRAVVSSN